MNVKQTLATPTTLRTARKTGVAVAHAAPANAARPKVREAAATPVIAGGAGRATLALVPDPTDPNGRRFTVVGDGLTLEEGSSVQVDGWDERGIPIADLDYRIGLYPQAPGTINEVVAEFTCGGGFGNVVTLKAYATTSAGGSIYSDDLTLGTCPV